MEYTKLGRTDLRVSRICFGTWQFGGDWGAQEVDENRAAIHRAVELGINFFDTAQGYGWGESERLLGETLRDELRSRRDELVIATKGGLRMAGDTLVRDASPQWLRQGVDESLEALGVDHIDLYQVHWPDPDMPPEETASALEDLVDDGKVRHVGVSNYDADEMEAFDTTRPVETLQPPYHLFRRDIEDSILPWCREQDVGVLVYGPLAHGLLSGKLDAGSTFPDDDWRSGSDLFEGEAFERNLGVIDELRVMAEGHGWTVPQLAVGWTLAQSGVHAAIVGARRPDQIEGTAAAADVELSQDDLAEIDRIMEGAVKVGGPSPEA